MDVRIGVIWSPKELTLEVDGDAAQLESSVTDALNGDGKVLWLTDVGGRRVAVPADRVAYVEIDADGNAKRVGFGPG
jgi:Protein of unknown function (DUF3107)